MKIKLEIVLELDDNAWMLEDESALKWFEREVMKAESLFVHSNEIGDELGEVKDIIKWELLNSEQTAQVSDTTKAQ